MAAAEAAGLDSDPDAHHAPWAPRPGARRTLRTEVNGRRALGRRLEPTPGRLARVGRAGPRPARLPGGCRTLRHDLPGRGRRAHSPSQLSPRAGRDQGRRRATSTTGPGASGVRGAFFRMVYRWLLRSSSTAGAGSRRRPHQRLPAALPRADVPGRSSSSTSSATGGTWRPATSASRGCAPTPRPQRQAGARRLPVRAVGAMVGRAGERTAFETGPDVLRMSMAWRRYTEAALGDGRASGPSATSSCGTRHWWRTRPRRATGPRLPAHRRRRVTPASSPRSGGPIRARSARGARASTPDQLAIIEADSGPLLRRPWATSG